METSIQTLANKYEVKENEIRCVLSKYDNLDGLYESYKEGKLEIKSVSEGRILRRIIKDIIDVDCNANTGYEKLYKTIKRKIKEREIDKEINRIIHKYGPLNKIFKDEEEYEILIEHIDDKVFNLVIRIIHDNDIHSRNNYYIRSIVKEILIIYYELSEISFFSSNKMQIEMKEILTEREKQVVNLVYGLKNGITKKYQEAGEELNISKSAVEQNINRAIQKLIDRASSMHQCEEVLYEDSWLTSEEREQINQIIKDIQLQNGSLQQNLVNLKSIVRTSKENLNKNLKQKILSGSISIKYLRNYSYEDLLKLGLTPKQASEISNQIVIYNRQQILDTRLDRIGINYSILKRKGIITLGDLSNYTLDEIRKMRNIGKKSAELIESKMREYGVSFKDQNNTGDSSNKRTTESVIFRDRMNVDLQFGVIRASIKNQPDDIIVNKDITLGQE